MCFCVGAISSRMLMSSCVTCWTTCTGSSSTVATGPLNQPPPRTGSDSPLLMENAACMFWHPAHVTHMHHVLPEWFHFESVIVFLCSVATGLLVLSHQFLVASSRMKSTAWSVGQNLGSLIHFLVIFLKESYCWIIMAIILAYHCFLNNFNNKYTP